MKKLSNILLMAGVALLATLTITSCNQEAPDTNPLNKKGVNLVAFGPNPVARGGYMRFMGTGMDQIKSITLAGQTLDSLVLVSNEEIKALIPQNADTGLVVLTTKDGQEIVGKRSVAYTEPVGFAAENAFTPNPIKAGATLTIKGEYLNLVTTVILPNDIEITEFAEQERDHIVINNFPAEAQTGKVTLSFVATGDTMAQEIPSETKLDVVLPSVASVKELTEVKPAQTVIIEGKDFDLIESVLSTVGEPLQFSVNDDKTVLVIFMPEVVMNGTIYVVTASGVQVPVATIGVALPKVTSVEGNTGVKAESVITINGSDLAIVSGINFVDINGNAVAAAAEGLSVTNTKVTVTLPAAAVTGSFTILTTAGINIDSTLFAIETLKPEVTEFAPAEVAMGGTVALNGTNLDLVKSVTLTGGAVLTPEAASATTFNLTIPYAEAETGKVTMTMHNGETVESEVELTIDAPEGCYATAWPDPEVEIKAGTMMVITVANIDKLMWVLIDGQSCQIIKMGDQVYIAVPESAGKNSVITLISDNGDSIDYPYAFVPNTEQKRSIWKGIQPLSWGDPAEGQVHIQYDDVFKSAPVGAELVICYTQPVAEWPQMQFNNGSWQAQKNLVNPDGSVFTNSEGAVAPKALYGDVTEPTYRETSLILTQEVLSSLVAGMDEWGNILHLQGSDFILNEVFLRWTISLETTLSTETFDCHGNPQPTVIPAGKMSEVGAKVGSKLRFYITADDGYWCQIVSGWWSPIGTDYFPTFDGNYDLPAHNGAMEIVLDETALAAFNEQGIVINADGIVITKITIE